MLRGKISSATTIAVSAVLAAGTLAAVLARVPTASAQGATQACKTQADTTRLDQALTHTAARLRSGQPLKIVAIGSSSTAGAGASAPAASYPSRLESELRTRFPNVPIMVVNRGVNGERAPDMIARFDQDVIAEKPDLVLWQVGSNSVLRDDPIEPSRSLIREGVARLKDAGADVVLMNPQFAPKIIGKHDIDRMVDLIDAAAKASNVSVFRRFTVMLHWKQSEGMEFSAFLSPDELHMNDWSYACIAKLLAGSIADAATRPAATAHALPQAR